MALTLLLLLTVIAGLALAALRKRSAARDDAARPVALARRSLRRVTARQGRRPHRQSVKSDLALVAGTYMIDKHRHRHVGAPHGSAPNWVLMLLGACAFAAAVLAGPLV